MGKKDTWIWLIVFLITINSVVAGSISTPANGSYPIVTPPRTINYSLVPSVNNSIYWDGHAFVAGAVSSIESDPVFGTWLSDGELCTEGTACGFISDGNTGWDNSYGFLTLINLTNYNPFNQVLNTTSDVHFNNINSSGNYTQQNLTISQNSTTVKFNTGGKGWCIGNCP